MFLFHFANENITYEVRAELLWVCEQHSGV